MKLLLLPGDGIGPEISNVVRRVIEAVDLHFDLKIELVEREIGFTALEAVGSTLPHNVLDESENADGIVLGPVDSAAYPSPTDGGINLSAALRKHFDLFANIRPSITRQGTKSVVKNMDLVVVRENTEGFYADRNMFSGSGEYMPTPDLALAIRKISRENSRRIGQIAAKMAAEREKRKMTIVTKSNVLKLSDGLFRDECIAAVAEHPSVLVEEIHVDAAASLFVRTPEAFDIVVTTNMFGDILSNLANELAGGLGLGGSLNMGKEKAVAQASHGSAPDIAGKNIANPSALLLSTGMLFEWWAEQIDSNSYKEAANLIREGVGIATTHPTNKTRDLGGKLGTHEFGEYVVETIEREMR